MSFDNPNRPGARKGLSALAATVLALIALSAGVVAWLAATADRAADKSATPAAVTLPVPPMASAAPGTAPAPPAAPPTAPQTAPPAAPEPVPQPPLAAPAPPPAAPEPQVPAAPDPPAPTPSTDSAPTTPATVTEAVPEGATEGVTEAVPEAVPPVVMAEPAPDAATPDSQSAALRPGEGLAPAPDPELVETSPFGRLPRVAPNGRRAWQAYARPFDPADRRPRIAIIIGNLGLSGAATESAIQRLPGPVTLSFSPYARGLDQWIALARAAGHEVLMDLPMEPINFPANDPGPETLLTSLTADQNMTRLHMLLGRVSGYVGVVNHMGSRFTTSVPHLRPVLSELRDRGLLFVDSRSSLRSVAARTASEIGLPRVINNRFIDSEASRDAIDARLQDLERIARVSGYAVGVGQPFPVTIDRVQRWTRDVGERGFALAPISAMANGQPD